MVMAKENVSVVFAIGAAGSGRYTQSEKIAEAFGYVSLHVCDLVFEEIYHSGTNHGIWLREVMKAEKKLPAWELAKLLKKEIESTRSHKFLIRGFPKDGEHCRAFHEIVGVDPDLILFLDCPETVAVERLLNHEPRPLVKTPGQGHAMFRRFDATNHQVMSYYLEKGVKVHKIDGSGTIDEVFERVRPIFAALEEDRRSK